MARPERTMVVPGEDRKAFEEWRTRVLSWSLPTDPPSGLRLEAMPVEYQDRIIHQLLIGKALRSGPTHWSRAIVEVQEP